MREIKCSMSSSLFARRFATAASPFQE